MNRVDIKVVLLGHEAVGKTSLMERFVHNRFNELLNYQNTIGAAFSAKEVTVDGRKLVLGIWDTAGSERYKAMTNLYYRGAKAAIVCYDILQQRTFQTAKYWIRELRNVEEECKIYLCATKKDMLTEESQRNLDLDSVRTYADGIQCKFFQTSSKTGENIDELFDEIAADFLSNPANLEKVEENDFLTTAAMKSKSSGCCLQG